MIESNISILISTKNRKNDLALTLNKINYLLLDEKVEVVIFDDGSTDGTYEYVKAIFPQVKIERNTISKGYLFCRNKMLNDTTSDFAVSLDDDAHFISRKSMDSIKNYFDQNSNCGLIALRIFWNLKEPCFTATRDLSQQVQGFVGCAHVWRMKAWHDIPNYPEWFKFYGEENFASYQLCKKNWEVHYLPTVLVNHRVDVKLRKNNTDYCIRLRRSLSTGWYLLLMFYPLHLLPRKLAYSIAIQFKLKVFKGDLKALRAIFLAIFDLVWNIPQIIKNSNRLTQEQYDAYHKLPATKIYWQTESES